MIRIEPSGHPDDAAVVYVTHPDGREMMLCTLPDETAFAEDNERLREAIEHLASLIPTNGRKDEDRYWKDARNPLRDLDIRDGALNLILRIKGELPDYPTKREALLALRTVINQELATMSDKTNGHGWEMCVECQEREARWSGLCEVCKSQEYSESWDV